jgi:hypothetical protein
LIIIRDHFLDNKADKPAGEIKIEPKPSLNIMIPNTYIENTKIKLIQYVLDNKRPLILIYLFVIIIRI